MNHEGYGKLDSTNALSAVIGEPSWFTDTDGKEQVVKAHPVSAFEIGNDDEEPSWDQHINKEPRGSTSSSSVGGRPEWSRGEVQPRRRFGNDFSFAILFYLHLVALLGGTFWNGPRTLRLLRDGVGLSQDNNKNSNNNHANSNAFTNDSHDDFSYQQDIHEHDGNAIEEPVPDIEDTVEEGIEIFRNDSIDNESKITEENLENLGIDDEAVKTMILDTDDENMQLSMIEQEVELNTDDAVEKDVLEHIGITDDVVEKIIVETDDLNEKINVIEEVEQDIIEEGMEDGEDGGGGERRTQDETSSDNADDMIKIHKETIDLLLFMLGISTVAAIFVPSLVLLIMAKAPQLLIKSSLFFVVGLFLLLSLPGGGALLFLLPAALYAFYGYRIWHRIPFAASNLRTAVTAIRKNSGLILIAYATIAIMVAWVLLWSFSFVTTFCGMVDCVAILTSSDQENQQQRSLLYYDDDTSRTQDDVEDIDEIPLGLSVLLFLLLVSGWWTRWVIINSLHVIVAGTVGTWWFTPLEASSFCSRAIRDSTHRTFTHAFGSICLGSLVMAVLEAIRSSLRRTERRSSGAGLILACLCQCLLSWIARLFQYFNRWAFIFVGLYGYSFVDAGKNVMTLFKSRGWTAIVNDTLIRRVAYLLNTGMGCLVGLLTGLVFTVLGLNDADSNYFFMGFVYGFILGILISSTLMSVVFSAVETVVVCFAEAPNDFERNHPKLCREMSSAWKEAWPNEFKSHSRFSNKLGTKNDDDDSISLGQASAFI